MAKLYFRVSLWEAKVDIAGSTEKIFERNLPHHDEIADWFPKCWEEDNPIQYFDAETKQMIASSRMKVIRQKDGRSVAIVEIEPVAGMRWSAKRREKVFWEMDAQFLDGFGESYDYAQIPGVPESHRLLIG